MTARRTTKDALKRIVKRTARVPGRWLRRRGVRILTYHSVGTRAHEMNVTPDDFRRQMEWLAASQSVIPLVESINSEGGVAITFDDGYRDNLTNAASVLKSLNLPATFFMVAGRAGGMLDHDDDPQTSTLMTWDELRELSSMGFEIGAHGFTHRRLVALTEDDQRAEISGSKKLIQEQLRIEVRSFAYPFGSSADYNDTSLRLVQEAGFCLAVSNRYGVNARLQTDPLNLKRIWIDATDDFRMFRAKVDGRLDVLSWLDTRAAEAARRWLNRIIASGA